MKGAVSVWSIQRKGTWVKCQLTSGRNDHPTKERRCDMFRCFEAVDYI